MVFGPRHSCRFTGLQPPGSVRVWVIPLTKRDSRGKERCFYSPCKTCQRTKCVIHGGSFVTRVNHAVRAFGIAALCAIVLPRGCFHQLDECSSIAILEQIARFLPAKDIVRGHPPRGAIVVNLALQ